MSEISLSRLDVEVCLPGGLFCIAASVAAAAIHIVGGSLCYMQVQDSRAAPHTASRRPRRSSYRRTLRTQAGLFSNTRVALGSTQHGDTANIAAPVLGGPEVVRVVFMVVLNATTTS